MLTNAQKIKLMNEYNSVLFKMTNQEQGLYYHQEDILEMFKELERRVAMKLAGQMYSSHLAKQNCTVCGVSKVIEKDFYLRRRVTAAGKPYSVYRLQCKDCCRKQSARRKEVVTLMKEVRYESA